MPEPGDIIGEKHELTRKIGRGGMGSVFEARHRVLGKLVAIKFLRSKYSQDREMTQRFLLEARAASSIGHRGIVAVHDVGLSSRRELYIVMDLLQGESLKQILKGGALPPSRAVEYGVQVSSALTAVHQKGIVHRDLKPSNLFVCRESDGQEQVKILDFGISKVLDRPDDPALTTTGALLGSPYTMAPEQALLAKRVDHRADIWSLGVILYHMLVGHPPYHRGSTNEILAQIIRDPVFPIERLCPALPEQLVEAVHKALQKRPEQRFQTAEELHYALRACREVVADLTKPCRPPAREAAQTTESGAWTLLEAPSQAPTLSVIPTTPAGQGHRPPEEDEPTWIKGSLPVDAKPTFLLRSGGRGGPSAQTRTETAFDSIATAETFAAPPPASSRFRTVVLSSLLVVVVLGIVAGALFLREPRTTGTEGQGPPSVTPHGPTEPQTQPPSASSPSKSIPEPEETNATAGLAPEGTPARDHRARELAADPAKERSVARGPDGAKERERGQPVRSGVDGPPPAELPDFHGPRAPIADENPYGP